MGAPDNPVTGAHTAVGLPPAGGPADARSRDDASDTRSRGGTIGLRLACLVAVGLGLAFTLGSALNGDVTYALGGIDAAHKGGVSVWNVFVARPVMYRVLLVTLDRGRALIFTNASSIPAQGLHPP
jgi:hypothetical protein